MGPAEFSSSHRWPARPTEADLAGLPGCPAVYVCVDDADRPVLLASTQHLRRLAVSRLLRPADELGRRADLAAIVRGVRWRDVHCPFEARWWYYRLARQMYPRAYRKLISFAPAWFLHMDWQQPIAELRVSERIWTLAGEFIGPWPNEKACQQALEGLWDLFDLCRYPDQVRRAPHGTRCAYAEMGRCDAPCDGSAPLAPYTQRCRSAWAFAAGGVTAWIEDARERMRQAAARQRYELAAQIKQQIAFARNWQHEWSPIVRRDEEMNWLLVLPATRRKAWKLFLFRRGELLDGPLLADRKVAAEAPVWLAQQGATPSAEQGATARDADAKMREPDATVRMEQTWLVGHLLYHREAAAAIIEPLPPEGVPPDLGGRLASALHERRAAKHRVGRVARPDMNVARDDVGSCDPTHRPPA